MYEVDTNDSVVFLDRCNSRWHGPKLAPIGRRDRKGALGRGKGKTQLRLELSRPVGKEKGAHKERRELADGRRGEGRLRSAVQEYLAEDKRHAK